MNVREAIKALADGGKVADNAGHVWSMDDDGVVRVNGKRADYLNFLASRSFTLHVEPATDEELIAEMERLHVACDGYPAASAWKSAAKMLRTRKVKP